MSNSIYFAPLQSFTTPFYRKAYNDVYGGIDKYFTPFFEHDKKRYYTPKLTTELNNELNNNIKIIPQVITNNSDFLVQFGRDVYELGYNEINLNLGCPHPPIVNKNMGSGLLLKPDMLSSMLTTFFNQLPNIHLSVKMRLGVELKDNWNSIIEILNQFPIKEIIIHPRTAKQQYKGNPDWDEFEKILKLSKINIIGNGDITKYDEYIKLKNRFPNAKGWMIGRGILTSPWLINEINKNTENDRRKQLKIFHDTYFDLVANHVTDKNVERNLTINLWTYLSNSFADGKRKFRKMAKKQTTKNYTAWADEMFQTPFIEDAIS
ncbi:MAG: tRNA-dihydrouridine synthase family protein [Marinilabiliaceae bacterium]|nr:tRNA-dihydrouridine synthase family protein [Marinilabiliaceae bacterium]